MAPKDLTPVPELPTAAFVPAPWQRVATYLHLQELIAGRDVVELWSGAPDPRGWQTLAARGAKKITVVAPVAATGGQGVVRHVAGPHATGLRAASCEVVVALELAAEDVAATVAEARRVLAADGVLVLGVASRDRPGATGGASYYDVVDACAEFAHVRMLGVAPFAGTTLVEYGVKDPEPLLDGTLVERGERVAHYVAVAGPQRREDFGYGVVQVPVDAVAVSPGKSEPRTAAAVQAPRDDKQLTELRVAIERHLVEMRARELELAERDAYIKELEHAGQSLPALEQRVAVAEQAREESANREREARKRIAELEGAARTSAPGHAVDSSELDSLRKKLADAESETWKHLRARSEAEATATALREDNQRKLKDARKLASAELMRATEEAMKKSVSLRDDLERSERLRKAAIAELEAHKGGGVELAKAKQELEAMSRAMHAVQTRALGEVEAIRAHAQRTAYAMEMELDQLRHERSVTVPAPRNEHDAERDRALQEQAEELVKLRAELARRDGAVERAAAAAAHERARAERFIADERQAMAERNDARAFAAESAAKVAGLLADKDRALTSLELERARAEKAESELAERKERVRELKRELELHRGRAAHGIARGRALESVRARVHALETAVLGEAARIASLESVLRAS